MVLAGIVALVYGFYDQSRSGLGLALWLPTLLALPASAARSRDAASSGWVSLYTLMPVLGLSVILVMGVLPSERRLGDSVDRRQG